MPSLIAFIQSPENTSVYRFAKAALEAEAGIRGLELSLRTDEDTLPDEAFVNCTESADAFILAAKKAPRQPQSTSVPVISCDLVRLARETADVLNQVLPGKSATSKESPAGEAAVSQETTTGTKFLVGVTSCPTGIAHTFMAAKALENAARELGYEMKVETRGSVGAKNELTPAEIERADAVIVAADAMVETARFAGKRLHETGTKAAINDAKALIRTALETPPATAQAKGLKMPAKRERKGVYKHLMTGVSHMLPIVVAGGLLIALAFAFGGIYAGDAEGTIGWALMKIGGSAAFSLFVPVLAGFIAFSIADRPGLTPGLIGGMLASQLGAGFLGGLAAGFMAGYLTVWLKKVIKLPESLQGLMPVLVLPLLSSLVVGLAMVFLVGPPVKIILDAMTAWLSAMQSGSAIVLGLILGSMMAFDMGGPVNKSAYTFSAGLLASQVYVPMAAVMAAGMVPPLACALAANIFRDRFTADERESSKAAAVLGISFITEGAIPYAAADPLRVIPALMAGSATTGAISMALGCKLMVPHGGIFVLAIPHAISHGLAYLGAIVAGTLVATTLLYFTKRRFKAVPVAA